jgi:hypothetical protein
MEISKQTLKKIIKEEILSVLSEEDASELSSEDMEMVKNLESLMLNKNIDSRVQGVEMMRTLLEFEDPIGLYVKENVFDKVMRMNLEYVLGFKNGNKVRKFYEKDSLGSTPFGKLIDMHPEIPSAYNMVMRKIGSLNPHDVTFKRGGRAGLGYTMTWLKEKVSDGE